jgi:hypothetical protein
MSKIISKKINWLGVTLGYFALLSLGLVDNARGPVFLDISRDLNLQSFQASLFFAVASTVAFFGSQGSPKVKMLLGTIGGLRLGLIFASLGFSSK